MSPESQAAMASKGFSGKAADIWALGVTFYAFTFLELPFDDENLDKIIKSIQSKMYFKTCLIFCVLMGPQSIRLTFPKTRKISKEYSELLLAMLEKDPKKRIKIKYNTI